MCKDAYEQFCPNCAHPWDDAKYQKARRQIEWGGAKGRKRKTGIESFEDSEVPLTFGEFRGDEVLPYGAKVNSAWYCPETSEWGYAEADMLACDRCNIWLHAGCIGISEDDFITTSDGDHPIYSKEFLCRICCKQRCKDIIKALQKEDTCTLFAIPVTDKVAPNYRDVIKNPMDLQTMLEKAESEDFLNYAWYTKVWHEAKRFYQESLKKVFVKLGTAAPKGMYYCKIENNFADAAEATKNGKVHASCDPRAMEYTELRELTSGKQKAQKAKVRLRAATTAKKPLLASPSSPTQPRPHVERVVDISEQYTNAVRGESVRQPIKPQSRKITATDVNVASSERILHSSKSRRGMITAAKTAPSRIEASWIRKSGGQVCGSKSRNVDSSSAYPPTCTEADRSAENRLAHFPQTRGNAALTEKKQETGSCSPGRTNWQDSSSILSTSESSTDQIVSHLRLLAKLFCESKANRDAASRTDTCLAVTKLLLSNVEKIQIAANVTLACLTHEHEVNAAAVQSLQGIPYILGIVCRPNASARLQSVALSALNSLSQVKLRRSEIIKYRGGDGIRGIVDALRHSKDNRDLQNQGCRLLGQLSDCPEGKRFIAEHDGIVAVAETIQKYPDDDEIRESALHAMTCFSKCCSS